MKPGDWFYDYEEGHFHHVLKVTRDSVTYAVVDDGITITHSTKPRKTVENRVKDGTWISRKRWRTRSRLKNASQSARVRVREHLKHPPRSCLCHRSKTVNNVRRGLIRRLK